MSEFCEKLEEKLKEVMTSEREASALWSLWETPYHIPHWRTGSCFYQSRFRRRAERGPEPVKRRKYPWTIWEVSNLLVSTGLPGAVVPCRRMGLFRRIKRG